MGVASEHEVAAFDLTEEELVAIVGYVPSEVGDADDEVALLLLAENVDILLGGLGGIDEGDALTTTVEDEAFQLGSQGEEADLQSVARLTSPSSTVPVQS